MDHDFAMRCAVAALQSFLTGEAVLDEDGVMRVPVEMLDNNGGKAISVDIESEPGYIVYKLVDDPPPSDPLLAAAEIVVPELWTPPA